MNSEPYPPDAQVAPGELDMPTKRAEALNEMVGKKIPLVEMFGPTIQGEGTVIGQQTYFLRFGLCDYKCTMCDSMHAVHPLLVKKNAEWLTQTEILDKFIDFRDSKNGETTKWVTFSGGNPAIHDLGMLLGLLKAHDFRINVETQGTRYQGWLNKVDSLTISPKGPGMGETHDPEVFRVFLEKLVQNAQFGPTDTFQLPALCFKIVVFDQRDLDFARDVFWWLKYESPLKEAFKGQDLSQYFYLSLGNPNPPPVDGSQKSYDIEEALHRYKYLTEDIMYDPILSQCRFLPQWHALVWGNDAGH